MSDESEEDKHSNAQKRGGAFKEVARGAPASRGVGSALPFRSVN